METQSLLKELESLRSQAFEKLTQVSDPNQLEEVRIQFLGRKGKLTEILRLLGTLPAEERPKVGAAANQIREEIQERWTRLKENLRLQISQEASCVDVTLPGLAFPVGNRHPIQQVRERIEEIFLRLGFSIYEGPEVETDYYNFQALNVPPDHPARDMQDTFYIEGSRKELLLRTHTSPVQIRVMEKQKPPIAMIAPGTVYRRDNDISRSPMFHQVEGLMVGERVTMGHLKGVLGQFCHAMFGPERKLRFRPSYFPFTEPSAEVDIECSLCTGRGLKSRGCRTCKGSGYLEILGCGMVHPAVFKAVGINPKRFSGFAFGLGIERIAMLKYGIDDIRLFYQGDLRFLEQF